MITRTIISTKVNVLVYDKATNENVNRVFTFGKKLSTLEECEKHVNKALKDSQSILLKVDSFEPVTELYGMTEQFFIENAVKLDVQTRKPLEA